MTQHKIVLGGIVVALLGSSGCVHRTASNGSARSTPPTSLITLEVAGDSVTIARDEFGVPHIFAKTNRGLFEGFGHAVAQDRLWQLEFFRRVAYGTLSEILGATVPVTNIGSPPGVPPSTALALDTFVRTRRYTPAELDAQIALLSSEEKEVFSAYADGVTRYITEVVAPDVANELPYEFKLLGLGVGLRAPSETTSTLTSRRCAIPAWAICSTVSVRRSSRIRRPSPSREIRPSHERSNVPSMAPSSAAVRESCSARSGPIGNAR